MTMDQELVRASSRMIKTTTRKLGLMATTIRGMKVAEAEKFLSFSPRQNLALQVKKCLSSAIANAQNNFGLDIDTLFVQTVSVGKGAAFKRFVARGRGKAASITRNFSNLYITLGKKE
ncbi:50S ribosomal protein L22 [Candidatus Phycorickettsia trachydisci]|uniref:50S ribosomal protein L22 n=2 Tax=Candidatus Phycorickettsia trachydisci TaxID=2115978 RepID=A0A2P1P8X7_9RICK|nr:50S ribosomal protein L22 [Candidatus Phycorickettsia trachydisci]AVP87728.1 50S ribosomal protein L22 [Candidatus Phycorickettsia trachydisci]